MEETDAAERPEPAWDDIAVLCAIAAGASMEEIAQTINGDADDVRRLVGGLERRGLLAHTPSRDPLRGSRLGVWALSDQGRTYLLDHIATWTRTASKLEEERRHVERLRTDLLSTISHELRTPLTLIRTSIGLLLDSEPDEEMRRRLLRNIKQSTDRMHILVTDLLDLARIRGDRFELQWRSVNLGRLVAGAVSLMRPLLDAKEQHVEIHVPEPAPVVPGDPRRLERVLLNLLGNANTFAAAGTSLTIAVSERDDEVIITVQDLGPGIPEEAMPHLFDQFFTARTSSSRFNIGAGLGLPIAKGIIEAHGGRIWVESTVGEGTTVAFALPRAWPGEEGDEGSGGR